MSIKFWAFSLLAIASTLPLMAQHVEKFKGNTDFDLLSMRLLWGFRDSELWEEMKRVIVFRVLSMSLKAFKLLGSLSNWSYWWKLISIEFSNQYPWTTTSQIIFIPVFPSISIRRVDHLLSFHPSNITLSFCYLIFSIFASFIIVSLFSGLRDEGAHPEKWVGDDVMVMLLQSLLPSFYSLQLGYLVVSENVCCAGLLSPLPFWGQEVVPVPHPSHPRESPSSIRGPVILLCDFCTLIVTTYAILNFDLLNVDIKNVI